ncbi:MAG: hypothetical protein PVF09_02750 [Desulfobacterales bacterium]|jgi:hypothetical protein
MIGKSAIIALSSLTFFCTSAYAQDWKDNWRNSPLITKNSNEWRKKSYVSKTSDKWRNSPLSARQSESKLRWDKHKWQKSPMYWRNSAYLKKPLSPKSWNNRWDKRQWRYSPLNWRSSQLRYKNTIKKYTSSSVTGEVKEWVISGREAIDASIPEEQKAYVNPQIETISGNAETIPKEAYRDGGHSDNYFIVYSGKHLFRAEKNLQKSIHLAPGGLIEIYRSGGASN